MVDVIARTSGRAAFHDEADDAIVVGSGFLTCERVLTDKIWFAELHRPVKPCLQRRDRLVELVAVQRHARLEPQNIARAETGGLEPDARSLVEQAIPQRLRVAGRDEQLEAVLARVSGPRDLGARTRDL